MSSYEKENRDGAETEEQRPPHRGGDRGQDQRVHIGADGIHVEDKGEEVHIGRGGIHVKGKRDQVDVGPDGVLINGEPYSRKEGAFRDRAARSFPFLALATLCYVIFVLAAAIGNFTLGGRNLYLWGLLFFLLVPLGDSISEAVRYKRFPTGMATVLLLGGFLAAGLLRGAWHPAWMLLLFIPLVQSAAGAVRNRNPHEFAFWLLALIAYLVLGFAPLFGIADRGLWHPGWVVFLLIPVYHSFVAYLRRGKRQ